MTDAHTQLQSHNYVMHYPPHPARRNDPHYRDFEEYHRRTHATAKCAIGEHRDDFSECSLDLPLELHHSHIEFSLQNGVNLRWLERDYPGISNPDEVGAWVETGQNLTWLCQFHHRGHGGVHVASASDYEAEKYVKELIS